MLRVLPLFLTLVASGLKAQSTIDSAVVFSAVGASLRDSARTVFHRLACHDGMHPCRSADGAADSMLVTLAKTAGAQLSSHQWGNIPCPWGYSPPKMDAGYHVAISGLQWNAAKDSASVLVVLSCANPPGYTHGGFERDDLYKLARAANGEWRVIGKQWTRITKRDDPLQHLLLAPNVGCT
jgi:hypothetical protein